MDKAGIVTALSGYKAKIEKLAEDDKFVELSDLQLKLLEVATEELEKGKQL